MRIKFFITFVSILLIVGGLFGGYFYLWAYEVAPLIDRFFETEINIQSLNNQNDVYRKKIEPDLAKNADDIQKIRTMFFKPEPILDYILFIEALAKRNSLVHTIATTPTIASPSSQITVTGTYQNVLKFLREIENDKTLIRVQSVTLQGSGESIVASIMLKLQSS